TIWIHPDPKFRDDFQFDPNHPNYLLHKALLKAGILEKKEGPGPRYAIGDSMLRFWFGHVEGACSQINAGRGRAYYAAHVRGEIHGFMDGVFRKMAGEYILGRAGRDGMPAVTRVTDYRRRAVDESGEDRPVELDLVGFDGKKIVLAGACKFRGARFGEEDLEGFLDKARFLPAREPALYAFSLSGFTDRVRQNACGVRLVDIGAMYA
ncbi:MAG: hypothetical protein HUK26_05710, partial [Duodenibacillus sp.]|nr:hypothetical protein [Duodenibacillus sp.]